MTEKQSRLYHAINHLKQTVELYEQGLGDMTGMPVSLVHDLCKSMIAAVAVLESTDDKDAAVEFAESVYRLTGEVEEAKERAARAHSILAIIVHTKLGGHVSLGKPEVANLPVLHLESDNDGGTLTISATPVAQPAAGVN